MRPFRNLLAALAVATAAVAPASVTAMPVTDEVIFILDSSGSVYDPAYANWQAEIDFARSVYESTWRADGSIAYSLINFAGCGTSYTVEQCKDLGRLEVEWDFSHDQSAAALDAAFDALGPDDFLGGYTWTDSALNLALEAFASSSAGHVTRTIVLITDGEPYPAGNEPWTVDNGVVTYESMTTQALLALGVVMNVVAVDVSQQAMDSFFSAPFVHLTSVDDFGGLGQGGIGGLVLPQSTAAALSAPASLGLMAFGFAGLRLSRRRR